MGMETGIKNPMDSDIGLAHIGSLEQNSRASREDSVTENSVKPGAGVRV